jgi:hypothetical protein
MDWSDCLAVFCGAVFCQEVVTNKPLEKSEVIATLPLFALRQLPVDQVIIPAGDQKNEWVLSASAAVGSALSSKQSSNAEWASFKNFYGDLVDKNPSRDQWLSPEDSAAIKAVDIWQQDYNQKSAEFAKKLRWPDPQDTQDDTLRKSLLNSFIPKAENVSVDHPPTAMFIEKTGKIGITYADPDAIGYIFALNKIIKENEKDHPALATNTSPEDFLLDQKFANNIRKTYEPIKAIYTFKSDSDRLPAVSNAIYHRQSKCLSDGHCPGKSGNGNNQH